jgi:hypothetical protein
MGERVMITDYAYIYFEDLSDRGKKKVLELNKIKSAREGDFDLMPIAILERGRIG